jgi:single-strand DNA-binding protein
MSDNTLTVVGNITRDAELKFLDSGSAVVGLSIAVNKRWKDKKTDEWIEKVSYFEVSAFGDLAENVANSLAKGARVVVTGQLEQRTWETDNGDKRSVVEIKADEISPSLKFATAVVTRTPRKENSGYTPGPAPGRKSDGSHDFSSPEESF